MGRRRIAEQPISRLAVWSRRLALFSLAATFVAIIIVRSGALDIVPALSTLAGALVLAVVAILLAFGAIIVIWREGLDGLRHAIAAALVGLALIAYPAYLGMKAYRLPAIYDVTTDPIDPPQFDAIARLRPRDANPIAYQGLYAAEQQHAAYPDIEPEDTTATPRQAFDVAMKVVTRRRWRIVDARPPAAGGGSRSFETGPPQDPSALDGIIEAVVRTPILGFPEDVVVRVRATRDGARIDVRSASRYGRNDIGSNAQRVQDLISDIDEILTSPQPQRAPERMPEKKPPPRSDQTPARGRSARR
ncbi:MAG: DUF1499 domain-containing protein [Pseudomonadota bacterium]